MDCDSDDFPDSFQKQALEILEPDALFDPSVPPQSGEEYLTHMLYERKRLPAIMVREPKKEHLVENACSGVWAQEPMQFDVAMPPELVTTPQWKMVQEVDFKRMRSQMDRMRDLLHTRTQAAASGAWLPSTLNINEWLVYCQTNSPVPSVILSLSESELQKLLEFVRDWLCVAIEDMNALDETLTERDAVIAAAKDLREEGKWLGRWLYAVLVCLSLPLEPDVYSMLRDIARVCIRLRSLLPVNDTQRVLPYSVFIFLIAKSFGQMDFIEYV